MPFPWRQTNKKSAGVIREGDGEKACFSESHQGGKSYRQMVETWCIYVTWNRIFVPDAVTSQDRSPPAVTRGGGGRGEGERTVLSCRQRVGRDDAWLLKGLGVMEMVMESLH